MDSRKNILMLEDDPDDRFITQSVLEALGHDVSIQFLHNSIELFTSLEAGRRPYLIILDYNALPENAVQVLRQLKQDDRFRGVPVIVLGETSSSKYITECYENGASSYIRKPSSNEATRYKIDTFFKYWLSVVEM